MSRRKGDSDGRLRSSVEVLKRKKNIGQTPLRVGLLFLPSQTQPVDFVQGGLLGEMLRGSGLELEIRE